MRFYRVSAGQEEDFFTGYFSPCPDLASVFLGPVVPLSVHVEIQAGIKPGDMIFPASNIVSGRFVKVLRSCNATGYDLFSVSVQREGTDIPGYFGLKLLGRGGRFDEERSEARRSPDGGAVMEYSSVRMDEARWDGADVFAIPGLGISMFVTERVREAIDKSGLVNVVLTPNTECYLAGSRLRTEWARIRRKKP